MYSPIKTSGEYIKNSKNGNYIKYIFAVQADMFRDQEISRSARSTMSDLAFSRVGAFTVQPAALT